MLANAGNKFRSLSIGQGMGDQAQQLVEAGYQRGFWIMLQNCHLLPAWLTTLGRLLQGAPETYCCQASSALESSNDWQPAYLWKKCCSFLLRRRRYEKATQGLPTVADNPADRRFPAQHSAGTPPWPVRLL